MVGGRPVFAWNLANVSGIFFCACPAVSPMGFRRSGLEKGQANISDNHEKTQAAPAAKPDEDKG